MRLPGAGAAQPIFRVAKGVARAGGPVVVRHEPRAWSAGSGASLTVLSANLWHDWPQHRRQAARLEQVARLVEAEGVDIALLQEVSRHRDLHADEWLAERLGMAYAYARANGDRAAIGFEEGLAVFSRFPLQDAALHHLGTGRSPFSRRLALAANLVTPCGPLQVFSVHLGLLPWQNAAQVAQLLNWVGARTGGAEAALVGGDFNAHEDSRQVAHAQAHWLDLFRAHCPHADGATHAWGLPRVPPVRRRLDYLFLVQNGHRWQVLDAQHVDAPGGPHSDHRAVLARLRR
jgi:endonuclease/exonuclease/phosphatase family metal-dependent hydrolase